jgi:natural product biosynthesis luciferase-like monooxygenase protein
MEFSLFYFANDSNERAADRYRLLLDGARFADRNGFAAIWTPERHFHAFGGLYPNPSVTGAAVAMVTERLSIRAGSVVAPLHHPLRIAEEWSVVDNLSNGRVGISFASGWNVVDFALNPGSHTDRRSLMDKRIEQVCRLWRGETIEVVDGRGKTQQVGIFPTPVQPELPIWITSGGHIETFRKAGHLGAGVLTHLLNQSLDELQRKIDVYRAAVAGRKADGWPGHVALMVHTYLGEREDETRAQVHDPMCDYLRSSLDLRVNPHTRDADSPGREEFREDDVNTIIEHAFDRYFTDLALLGTVDKVRRLIDRFRDIGVDELACLIDFGVPTEKVLSGLEHLNTLRDLTC